MRPAQPVGVAPLCDGVLPLKLLIGVREEVGGQRLIRLELRLGGGGDESSDVGDDGCVVVVEERLNIGEVGIERKVGQRCERQKLVLRDGERTANAGVVVVAVVS